MSPGDIIFGDDDGIVVMTEEECTKVIPIAQEILERELKILGLLAKNQSLIEMMNFLDHYDKIYKGEKSQLVFTI